MAELSALCEAAMRGLDAVLAATQPPERDLIADATRCIARLRDDLIERQRSGRLRDLSLLPQANALLSELVAAEFPLVGVRKKRIEVARDACQRLLQRSASQS
jgi:hypothetical protein